MTGVGTGGCATINPSYFKKNRAQQNKGIQTHPQCDNYLQGRFVSYIIGRISKKHKFFNERRYDTYENAI